MSNATKCLLKATKRLPFLSGRFVRHEANVERFDNYFWFGSQTDAGNLLMLSLGACKTTGAKKKKEEKGGKEEGKRRGKERKDCTQKLHYQSLPIYSLLSSSLGHPKNYSHGLLFYLNTKII